MEQNNNKLWLALALIVIFLCIGFCLYTKYLLDTDPALRREYEAAKAESQTPEYQAQKDKEAQEFADKALPYVVGLVVLFIVLAAGGDIVKAIGKPMMILIFFIAIFGVISYFFGFSDKNHEGVGDSQVIMAVQPSGTNAKTDEAYAEINKTNAEATMTHAISLGFLWIIFAIGVFMLGFVSIYLSSWRKTED
jgi:beta-lactamase regulating signal transducer with metallopeptidase domain